MLRNSRIKSNQTNDGSLRYMSDGSIIMESSPYVTKRYYLCDSVFLVGLECDDMAYLEDILSYIKTPKFPLFLGRRSCPITLPVNLGIVDMDLETALRNNVWIAADWFKDRYKHIRARIITEIKSDNPAVSMEMDQPVSFSPIQRKHTLRGLNKEQYVFLGTTEHPYCV